MSEHFQHQINILGKWWLENRCRFTQWFLLGTRLGTFREIGSSSVGGREAASQSGLHQYDFHGPGSQSLKVPLLWWDQQCPALRTPLSYFTPVNSTTAVSDLHKEKWLCSDFFQLFIWGKMNDSFHFLVFSFQRISRSHLTKPGKIMRRSCKLYFVLIVVLLSLSWVS